MALYDYICSNCKSVNEHTKKIAERDECKDIACPDCGAVGLCERTVNSALVAYSIVTKGYGRAPDSWKEVLQKVHSRAPGSNLDKISSVW